MSRIGQIRWLVREGLYYLTEHAVAEAEADGFDIMDVERAILMGRMGQRWPREGKCEIVGPAMDGRSMGIICRITRTAKVRVITVYAHP